MSVSAFEKFAEQHKIENNVYDRDIFNATLRFVRINSLARSAVQGEDIDARSAVAEQHVCTSAALLAASLPVSWATGLRALPATTLIRNLPGFSAGEFYGIDAPSAAAVFVLDAQPGEKVLDLCCAPGAKFSLLAECMRARGLLVGVDISKPRLGACATLLQRHNIVRTSVPQPHWRCLLVASDGRKFGCNTEGLPCAVSAALAAGVVQCVAPEVGCEQKDGTATIVVDSVLENICRVKARIYKGLPPPVCVRFRNDARLLSTAAETSQNTETNEPAATLHSLRFQCTCDGHPPTGNLSPSHSLMFDRVLVDAECTHDASLKHVHKLDDAVGSESRTQRALNKLENNALRDLQRGLLQRGFQLLRPGGTLVYSTCSLATEQNEEILTWLFETEPTAVLCPIDAKLPPRFVPTRADNDAPTTQDAYAALHATSGNDSAMTAARASHLIRHCSSDIDRPPWVDGKISGTKRFIPGESGCSGGLFIAKITKQTIER